MYLKCVQLQERSCGYPSSCVKCIPSQQSVRGNYGVVLGERWGKTIFPRACRGYRGKPRFSLRGIRGKPCFPRIQSRGIRTKHRFPRIQPGAYRKTSVSPYLADGGIRGKPRFPRIQPGRRFPVQFVAYPVNSVRFPPIMSRSFPYFLQADRSASPYGELEFYILLAGQLVVP